MIRSEFKFSSMGFAIAVFGCWAFSCAVNIYLSSYRIPYVNGDGMFFCPQVLSYAQGNGMRNEFYDLAKTYSPTGDGRHVWHGFLYQIITSRLMRTGNYDSFLLINRIFDGLSLATVSLCCFFSFSERRRYIDALFTLLATLGLSGYLLGLQGRPEILSILFVCFGALSPWISNLFLRSVWLGVFFGLSLVTSPIQGFIFGVLLGLFTCCYSISLRHVFLLMLVTLVTATLTVFVAFLFYPYLVHELVSGVLQHRGVLRKTSLLDVFSTRQIRNLTVHTGRFMLGPILLFGVLSSIMIARQKIVAQRQSYFISVVAAITFTLLYLSISSGWYVLAGIAPVFIALLASAFVLQSSPIVRIFFLSLLILVAVDPLLHIASSIAGLNGMPRAEAVRSLCRDLGSDSIENVAFSTSGYLLVDNQENNDVLTFEEFRISGVKNDARWLVVLQEWNDPVVSIYEGYQLRISHFVDPKNVLLPYRLKQWFYPAGFQYALYERLTK